MPSEAPAPYPSVPPRPDLPEIERRIIGFWVRDDTFQASIDERVEDEEFVFYDGPPFANALPHYGHLLTGYMKDAVPRYQTMLGRRVERRFGWDCHGLPAEMEAVRELGMATRDDVLTLGIGRFNDHCRTSVLRYASEWENYVTRQARWVDFADDYKTLDLSYMESVVWAFKRLWDEGLVNEGTRVLPYCWECETPLSHFETRLDDAYRAREDPALTVAFRTEAPAGVPGPLRVLAWTTTPWTLPSNLALAVHPEVDYAIVESGDTYSLLAAERLDAYRTDLGDPRTVATLKGAELAGLRYEPLFDFFSDAPGAFMVLEADFATTDEGTGVVHLAPGFGEEDHDLCTGHGIDVICPVDDRGRFTDEVPPYAGQLVLDANAGLADDLRRRGLVLRDETVTHDYPHCWRTDTPLIYRALSSWFVRVTALKDRLLELAEEITWVPPAEGERFRAWLEGARDWCVSRNRFWGAPIPVWRSDDPDHPRVDVYGSLDEVERDFGVRPDDLHRPAIDELTRPNPDDPTGNSTMRRVPEVLDCWFESGSMPFAQDHYPFEDPDGFERRFPADFVCEYRGQVRAWFYKLHVLACALFDRPAFRTVVTHGVLLGDDGRQMSKRLRNYPDPGELLETEGADALRWYLLASPALRGQDMAVQREGVREALRSVVHPLWNTWHFLGLYANADGIRPRWRIDAAGALDRYLLAETRELVVRVREHLDAYAVDEACAVVRTYLEALTNWYVRRSRGRFWRTEHDDDKRDAYDTLHTALEVLCRTTAPLLPLVTEEIYRGLTGERSVHLADFPDPDDLPGDPDLVRRMRAARRVCSAAASVRDAYSLRLRLPLPRLTVAGPDAPDLEPLADLIAAEANVKRVELAPDASALGREALRVELAKVGPRLGPETRKVLDAARRGDWARLPNGRVEAGGMALEAGEWTLTFEPHDPERARAVEGLDAYVALDTETTPELEEEGLVRDVVRVVQTARKEAGLEITDRARVAVDGPEDVLRALQAHEGHLASETLAAELVLGETGTPATDVDLPDGRSIRVAVTRS